MRLAVGVAVAMFLGSVLTSTLTGMTGLYGDPPAAWVSLALLAAATLPLAARLTHPWQVLLAVAAAFGVAGQIGVQEYLVLNISLFLALYSEGAWDADRRRAAWVRLGVVLAMLVWLLVNLFQLSTDPDVIKELPARAATGWSLSPLLAFSLIQLINNAVYFAGAYWFGERAWASARDRAALEDLARRLSAERRRGEQQAVAWERVRIARELHDAVAHHVSLIGVQAGAARLAVEGAGAPADPVVRDALVRIEDASRQAVDEMHGLLRTLRHTPGDPTDSLGVDRLPDLVAESCEAGVPTTLAEIGAAVPLPPLVSLTLYRVAQEALTNVRRHAGPATATDVRVRHGRGWVELEVANARPARHLSGGRSRGEGAGLGLVGMAERVGAIGGALETGPLSGGGWVVRARIPLEVGHG